MQELVLNQPVSTARSELVREAAQADARREFEERLAECGQALLELPPGIRLSCLAGVRGAPCRMRPAGLSRRARSPAQHSRCRRRSPGSPAPGLPKLRTSSRP